MADAIRLQHVNIRIDTNLYFYDGEVPVVGGVVTLDNEVWARNAWLRGYRINADTGEQVLPGDIVNHFAVVDVPVAETTEAPAATAEATEEAANGEQGADGLAVELAGVEEAGVPEAEATGPDEASQDD